MAVTVEVESDFIVGKMKQYCRDSAASGRDLGRIGAVLSTFSANELLPHLHSFFGLYCGGVS